MMDQRQFEGLVFGIPREIMLGERRVAVIPDTVKKMAAKGARVIIEKGAEMGAYDADEDYRNAGAEIE